jgi:cell division protein ZapE
MIAKINALPPKNILQRYHQWIAQGVLHEDEAQAQTVEALAALQKQLMGYSPPSRIQERVLRLLPIARKPAPRGMYLYGGVGRGKSMLMDVFYETAPVKAKKRIHYHAFMRDLHADIHQLRQEGVSDPILPIARKLRDSCTLLCLDEFEVRDVADAMLIVRLFALLFKRGVVLVMTSNRAPQALYPHGLQRERFMRFISLMLQKIDVIALDGSVDYRLQKLKSLSHTYITPVSDLSTAVLEEAFAQLSNHQPPRATTLTVQGREVIHPRTCPEILYTTFTELCEKPLGAADYLAIAETFAIVCLQGIPLLTPEKRNEARRFVMLIDALYDGNVKFLCTAAAVPQDLYPAGDGSFEFARTASRLQEMQSESYWAEDRCAVSEETS